jgi:hypothetical protein
MYEGPATAARAVVATGGLSAVESAVDTTPAPASSAVPWAATLRKPPPRRNDVVRAEARAVARRSSVALRGLAADGAAQLVGQRGCIACVPRDHETRIVARDRPDDARMAEPVEGAGDGGRGPEL